MPKKKNFLGGMQNYNPNNGEYEPSLQGPNGESPSGFKSFKKKEDESFNQAYEKYKKMGHRTDDARMMAYRDSRDTSEDDRLNAIIEERIKRGYDQRGTYDPTAIKDLGYLGFGSLDALEEHTFGKKSSFDEYNDKRMGKETTQDSSAVGKIAKYSPFMRQADGSWKKDDTQQKRIKTLHNGLGIETKAQDKEHVYHEQIGKYRLVDIETGTTVGWAKDFDDAIKKSQDQDFIGAINRAKKIFLEKHPELKESSGKPVDYNAKRLGKSEGEMAKKEMEKARKRMEKFWANTDTNKHMKSEMDYLLSNFEHDNDKKGALELAKGNIKKWQKNGFLDTNEMRDEKLVYFNKMIKYMEKNL